MHPALLASAVGARLERARFLKSLLHRDGLTRLLTARVVHGAGAAGDRPAGPLGAGPASLVLLDVDHFKRVNDTYGHQAGDRVLATPGRLAAPAPARTDIIGRYGGEEFGVLLDHLPIHDAQRLITRLLNEFAVAESHRRRAQALSRHLQRRHRAVPDGVERHAWIEAADQTRSTPRRDQGRNRVHVAS